MSRLFLFVYSKNYSKKKDLKADKKCAILDNIAKKLPCMAQTIRQKRVAMISEYTYCPQMDFYIERVDRDTGLDMPSFHIHHNFEIYYEIAGTRRYFVEGAAYIVNAGSVVLIGENQIHKTASLGEAPSSHIALNFSREFLQKVVAAFPDVDFFSFLADPQNHLLSSITVKQQNHIQNILQQMLDLEGETSPEGQVLRAMLLTTLLLELKKMCLQQQQQGGEKGRVSNHIVEQIQAYIAQHYAEKLTLTGIASQFYISPYYLSRLFKKSTNLSLIEYINGVRIKAAQHLIEQTAESISSVAGKTGFMTTAHFRRVFKDATGLSPQQYRQQYKRLQP